MDCTNFRIQGYMVVFFYVFKCLYSIFSKMCLGVAKLESKSPFRWVLKCCLGGVLGQFERHMQVRVSVGRGRMRSKSRRLHRGMVCIPRPPIKFAFSAASSIFWNSISAEMRTWPSSAVLERF